MFAQLRKRIFNKRFLQVLLVEVIAATLLKLISCLL
jgi:hypothetical protein